MASTIICPHCDKEFEMSEAVRHEIEEKERKRVQEEIEQKQREFDQKLEKQQKEARDREEALEKRLQGEYREAFDKRLLQVKAEAEERTKQEVELELKKSKQDAEIAEKNKQKAQDEVLEMSKQMAEMREEQRQREIDRQREMQKKEEEMEERFRKQANDEQRLKIAEKDKQLSDAIKANEELRRKLEQGSQQTQGEVLELELEEELRSTYIHDLIDEVPKGIRGADVLQTVRDSQGRVAGVIVWESKNTKAFSPGWIAKLKDDQRTLKSEIAVLVTSVLPEGVKRFGFQDGIWISDWESALGLAAALRTNLLQLAAAKRASAGKEEKKEILYEYLSGVEFRQRVEAIVEGFHDLQNEIEQEKRWFARKWSRQEKQIRMVVDNTHGMYGDLQGMMGAALPEVGGLMLEEREEK